MPIIRVTRKQIETANKAREAALKKDDDFRRQLGQTNTEMPDCQVPLICPCGHCFARRLAETDCRVECPRCGGLEPTPDWSRIPNYNRWMKRATKPSSYSLRCCVEHDMSECASECRPIPA